MIAYEKLSRRELKALRAKLVTMKTQLDELDSKIGALNGQKDKAADVHKKMTEPLQVERKKIEDKQTSDIVDEQPIDAAAEQRRINLTHEIDEANALLERTVAECDRRIELLQTDRRELVKNFPQANVVDAWLLRTSDEQKQIRHHGLIEAAKEISNTFLFGYKKRVDGVRDELQSAERTKDESRAKKYRPQLARMEAVYNAAVSATSRLQQEASELYKELIEA